MDVRARVNGHIPAQLLVRLCQLLGIADEYEDNKHDKQIVSAESLRQIIEVMGYPLSDELAAQQLVEQLETRQSIRLLPSVFVFRENQSKLIKISVTPDLLGEPIAWVFRSEDKQSVDGFSPVEKHRISGELVYAIELPKDLPLGYHELIIKSNKFEFPTHQCNLIIAPQSCYQTNALADKHQLWGINLQLYTLRSERNWGIGDFTDLKDWLSFAHESGADFVGINPLHALFPENSHYISPYSPSNRIYLNFLYLDIAVIDDFAESSEAQQFVSSAGFQQKVHDLRALELVDYEQVTIMKLNILHILFNNFLEKHLALKTDRAQQFWDYTFARGESLYRHALYDALYAKFYLDEVPKDGWLQWPEEYKDINSPAVKEFADYNRDEICFYQYLQWLCDLQLTSVQRHADDLGMEIGLYRDLAVGASRSGSEIWSQASQYCLQASIGAPPDALAIQGQDWQLPPLDPHRLKQHAYSQFISLVRANMQYCGALRIDHVMGLARLWWLPKDEGALNGAYVQYPLDDLLAILALESQRNQCIIIGEDLGTVPKEIIKKLPANNIYSYKVMYFEKANNKSFRAPADYQSQAITAVSTHDLPTLVGWWEGEDIAVREELKLFASENAHKREYKARDRDRRALLQLLHDQALLPDDMSLDPDEFETLSPALMSAIHQLLARSRSALMGVQPEDLMFMNRSVNVPGTTNEYPNWRQKLVASVDELKADSEIINTLAQLNKARKGR